MNDTTILSKIRNLCVILALSIVSAATALSDVPPYINYQGTLTGQDGKPLATGPYTLKFSVYDTTDGAASPVWGPQVFDGTTGQQGHAAQVQVVNGAFNVILGPEDTQGRPLTGAFASGTAYLGITVGDSTEISPRQAILSAPFAMQAPLPKIAYLNLPDTTIPLQSPTKVTDATVTLKLKKGHRARARITGHWFSNPGSPDSIIASFTGILMITDQNSTILAEAYSNSLTSVFNTGGPYAASSFAVERFVGPFNEDKVVDASFWAANSNTRGASMDLRGITIQIEEFFPQQFIQE